MSVMPPQKIDRIKAEKRYSELFSAYSDQFAIVTKLRLQIANLFEAIKHGDEIHQAWLKAKIEEHFK